VAYVQPLAKEEVRELASLFGPAEAVLGFVPNSLLTLARRPEILRALAALSRAAFAPGGVGVELKMLVAYVSSTAAGCRYCQAHSASSAVRAGLPTTRLATVWDFEHDSGFTEAEKAALRLARDASIVPNAVTEGSFGTLRKHFSDDDIVELMAVIATMGWLNRWNDTMATELEPEPLAVAAANLPSHQWQPGKHASR
jgi:uncharacterized peroxidase-related enzyme